LLVECKDKTKQYEEQIKKLKEEVEKVIGDKR